VWCQDYGDRGGTNSKQWAWQGASYGKQWVWCQDYGDRGVVIGY